MKHLGLLCFFIFSLSAQGEMLIIQSSDQHSSYKNLPHFLASIEVLSREFKKSHPKGKLVLVINGDFSSHPEFWSFKDKASFLNNSNENPVAEQDKGTFAYEILAQLAQKYTVIYTFGNHDAFDWRSSQLFLDQMRILKKADIHLLAANTVFDHKYREMFQPYVDIPFFGKKKWIRFAGFTLPHSKEKRIYPLPEKGPPVIQDILPIQVSLLEITKTANKSHKLAGVVLSLHLGFYKTKQIFQSLRPKDMKKVRLIFAGHDHLVGMDEAQGVPILDSGSFFEFSAVILNNKGQILFKRFFGHSCKCSVIR